MTKLSDYIRRICICHNEVIYKIFTLWFSSDGGYFIKDLCSTNNHKYIISKVHYKPTEPFWESQAIPRDKENTYTISCNDPKITHHIDWNCHVSGTWIRSWFNADGTPKGVHVLSWNLYYWNDGWPMFIFNIWLSILKSFPITSLDEPKMHKCPHVTLNENIIIDLTNGDTNYNYILEWYYIQKKDLPDNMKTWMLCVKEHPTYGLFPLIPLYSPPESPYIFAIGCIRDNAAVEPDFFSYGGAPWITQEDGSRDMLSIILLPNDAKIQDINNSLDFSS